MQTTLQIPVKKQLRDRAVRVAEQQGFSSLQEAVRVFLNQFAAKNISISFTSTVPLSTKNEQRYVRMVADVTSGRVKTKKFTTASALMQHLTR